MFRVVFVFRSLCERSEWIHDVILVQGGRELWYRTSTSTQDDPLLFQQSRLALSMAPVAGTPFDRNVICISEKNHRTPKWLMAVAAGVPCVKVKRSMLFRNGF